ncbi:hypothetical protein EV363DRAFT_1295804 [Boletus edulis]|nr:hypothetical protein EV363DRAFT_1295804 [Boletus edulis]
MVWDKPQAISKAHPQGFEFICLKGYLKGFQALFGAAVEENILVRDEYRIAIQDLQKHEYRRGAYVTGQPGIGKSLFLVYLLVQLLGQGCKVAVHDYNHQFYAVFTNTVAFYPITDPAPLATGGPMWALSDSSHEHDGAPPGHFYAFPQAVRLIQATSLKKKRWHEWSKQAKAKCYVMDIWTEQETANLANLLGYNGQRMVDLWKKWGGAPGTLLTYLEESDQEIENWHHDHAIKAIGTCQDVIQSIVNQQLFEGSDAPSRFYFCRPADYATSSIHRKRTALQQLSNAIKLEFFTALSQCNDTRQAAEFIYQTWFHCFISTANKSIDCHWLDEPDKVTKLYGTTNLASESAKERKELPYYWPASTGYPGIDGALICDNAIFAFQITLSSTHPSPEPGVRKLRAQLPANLKRLPWHVVFVGNLESSSEAVAQQWIDKVFLTADKPDSRTHSVVKSGPSGSRRQLQDNSRWR